MPEYNYIDVAEDLDSYCPGGYHPIDIGVTLHRGRYEVVHKLGHGSYSTVWLAKDIPNNKYVAIKICRATSDPREIQILRKLASQKDSAFQETLCSVMLDSFNILGPNGRHPCLVQEPARCNLYTILCDYECFPHEVARSVAAQLVLAVAHVHAQGIVHGDLNYGNLLLKLSSSIDQLDTKGLYKLAGVPEAHPITRTDGQPIPADAGLPRNIYPIMDIVKPAAEFTIEEARLVLCDFGTAFFPAEKEAIKSLTPFTIQAPEVHFEPDKALGYSADVWSMCCMIWAIMGVGPFAGTDLLFSFDDVLDVYMQTLGPLPDAWWEKWDAEHRDWRFESNGVPCKDRKELDTLEERFERSIQYPRRVTEGMELVSPEEKEAFLQMTKDIMKFDPKARPTARQVIDMKWMKEWGIPAAEKSWGRKIMIGV